MIFSHAMSPTDLSYEILMKPQSIVVQFVEHAIHRRSFCLHYCRFLSLILPLVKSVMPPLTMDEYLRGPIPKYDGDIDVPDDIPLVYRFDDDSDTE